MGNNMSDIFISSWGIKIRHPLELYIEMGSNMSDIFISSWGIKICHPLELYIEMGKKGKISSYHHEELKSATPLNYILNWNG